MSRDKVFVFARPSFYVLGLARPFVRPGRNAGRDDMLDMVRHPGALLAPFHAVLFPALICSRAV
jgi:hypothetical protein